MNIDRQRFRSAVKNQGEIKAQGVEPFLPKECEESIARTIEAIRIGLSYPVYKSDVILWANKMIEGTAYASKFKEGMVTNSWYQGFLSRNPKFTTMYGSELEQDRAKWLTSENV